MHVLVSWQRAAALWAWSLHPQSHLGPCCCCLYNGRLPVHDVHTRRLLRSSRYSPLRAGVLPADCDHKGGLLVGWALLCGATAAVAHLRGLAAATAASSGRTPALNAAVAIMRDLATSAQVLSGSCCMGLACPFDPCGC